MPEAARAIETLFPARRPLVYETTLRNKPLGRQWTPPPEEIAEGLRWTFLVESDPSAAGLGGDLIRQRGVLVASRELRPIRYTVETTSASLDLVFTGDTARATLGDGTVLDVPAKGVDALLHSEMVGQLATLLCWSGIGRARMERTFNLFLANQLLTITYRVESREGNGVFESSFREQLRIAPDGVLAELLVPASHVRSVRLFDTGLPQWANQPIAPSSRPAYAPTPNASYRTEDVDLPTRNGSLGATLTLPVAAPPAAGVLILSGSGPIDRHGIAGQIDTGVHEIADGLAQAGVAGLRADKPGTGSTPSGAAVLERGFRSRVADAEDCLEYLRQRLAPGTPLMIAGHSEGALIALTIASERLEPVAAVALLAPPGRPLDQIIEDQLHWRARQLELSDDALRQQLEEFREYLHWVKDARDWDPAIVPARVYAGLRSRLYFREVLAIDPAVLIGRTRCPVWLAQGTEDVQISPTRDADRLARAARESGTELELHIYPGLDHLFKPVAASKEPIKAYYDASRRVQPAVIGDLGKWMKDVASRSKRDVSA